VSERRPDPVPRPTLTAAGLLTVQGAVRLVMQLAEGGRDSSAAGHADILRGLLAADTDSKPQMPVD
jgi:hypothetical protein